MHRLVLWLETEADSLNDLFSVVFLGCIGLQCMSRFSNPFKRATTLAIATLKIAVADIDMTIISVVILYCLKNKHFIVVTSWTTCSDDLHRDFVWQYSGYHVWWQSMNSGWPQARQVFYLLYHSLRLPLYYYIWKHKLL